MTLPPVNDETLETIIKISKILAPKYVFPTYDIDDIVQEATIIGIKSLPQYNKDRGTLYSYLFIHINNRLKTLKRDNYYRPLPSKCDNQPCSHDSPCSICQQRIKRNNTKKSLAAPVDVDELEITGNHEFPDIDAEAALLKIDANLPMNYREDYLKMVDGFYVPRQRRLLIEEEIYKILGDEYGG